MLPVTVVTPSLPEREGFRAECIATVAAQLQQPEEHMVWLDEDRVGVAAMQNWMLESVATPWYMLLADDDLLDADHLKTLWEARTRSTGMADIVYSWCRVVGRDWNPNRQFDAGLLRLHNYIPAVALVRTSLARELEGWRTEAAHGWEDWDFWLRALDVGARFYCVERITWTYRFHGTNISWG